MVDVNCDYVLLTQSTLIRRLNKKQYNVLVDISLSLNDLRNSAVDVTYLFNLSDGLHYGKWNFKSVIERVREEFSGKYKNIQAHIANAAIRKHVESFNGFVELKNMQIDGKYDRKVNPLGKHELTRLHNIIIPKESITSI